MDASNEHVARTTERTEAAMAPQSVPVNVYEAGERLVVVAPMVAVTPEDVHVEITGHDPAVLRIWAHLRSAGPREYLVHEWEYGGYERNLELPPGWGAALEATLNNGQLVVRVAAGAPRDCSTQPTPPAA